MKRETPENVEGRLRFALKVARAVSDNLRLLTMAEVAGLANVSRQSVYSWRRSYPDFPRPVAICESCGRRAFGLVFRAAAVVTWLKTHRLISRKKTEPRKLPPRSKRAP